jgi:hypothetical protein
LIIVFDSGVWISALQFKGTPLVALNHAVVKHEISLCDVITFEINRVLRTKFAWSDERIEQSLADYLAIHLVL